MTKFTYRRSGSMGQPDVLPKTDNEIGFAICKGRDGRLVRGPVVEGTPTRVTIPLACPPETRLVGMGHTHPGKYGVAFPSDMDIQAALTHDVPNLCIGQPETGVVNCFSRKR